MTLYNNYEFSLTIIPGLEELAKEEFAGLWTALNNSEVPELTSKKGKVYFSCDVPSICNLVPYLRIPTQVYMRLENFQAKDSSKLYKKLSKINWSKFLRGDIPIVSTSARESKLINTAMIKDKAVAAINDSSKHSPIKKAPKNHSELRNRIHIDIYKDQVKVELSLCGERLDKRGVKTLTDKAPIRESIAGAMVYKLAQITPNHILDPMCGSGTFCSEIALRNSFNTFRNFDYQFAPYFITLPLSKRISIEDELITNVTYSDIDSRTLRTAKENITKFKTEIEFSENLNSDFFKLEDLKEDNSIILNPPYGKRVKLDDGLEIFLKDVLQKASELKSTKYLAIVFPKWAKSSLAKYKSVYKTELSNGGIEVLFTIIQLD